MIQCSLRILVDKYSMTEMYLQQTVCLYEAAVYL